MSRKPEPPKDFFISYTGVDRTWAEWIAFALEEAGYTTVIQAWDSRPGMNFVAMMNDAMKQTERTIAVLSGTYLESEFGFAEWAAAFRRDPTGSQRRLVPVRIEACEVQGLLRPIAYLDLVGLDEAQAKEQLLAGVKQGRAKPLSAAFPGSGVSPQTGLVAREHPVFPGSKMTSVENIGSVQGQVIGDHATIHNYFYDSAKHPVGSPERSATISSWVDVCVVCALAQEAQAFLRVVEERHQVFWTSEVNHRYGYDYRLATIANAQGDPLRVQMSWLPRYGPQEMTLHLGRVLEEYRPRLVVMTGICAGDQRAVYLGDLVVAERTFIYDNGKIVQDADGRVVHLHDTTTYQMPENLLRFVHLFEDWKAPIALLARPLSKRQQRDWLLERLYGEPTGSVKAITQTELRAYAPAWRQLLDELQRGAEPLLLPSLVLRDKEQVEHLHYGQEPFPFHDPQEARCHIKPMASGNAVRSDNPFQDIQAPVRGTVAIDMEGAAFGRVMESSPGVAWLIVKGVADYADRNKDDSYHDYAATASAAYALCFLEQYVTQERLPKLPASRDGPKNIWNIPYPRNPFFTGRTDLLTRLAATLHTGQPTALSQPQAISGLGGIGKTQIAIEYAYEHEHDYQAVLWAQADTRENLIASFLALASVLDLPAKEASESAQVVAAVKHWLQTTRGYLLILDNADDLALAREFLPVKQSGQVMLTTRAQITGHFAHRLEVDELPTEQGMLLLLRRAGLLAVDAPLEQASQSDQVVAKHICEELGGLPLALDQAGAYIEETRCGLARYQQRYQRQRGKVLAERRGELVNDHPLPVATTWNLSFEQVEQRSPAAADLLRVCAFLAPDAIPETILTKGAAYVGPQLAAVETDADVLDKAVEVLRAYSLVRRDAAQETLSVHRLVQAVLRDQMSEEEQRQWAERVVRATNAAFPEVEHRTWSQCEVVLPHAVVMVSLIEQYEMTMPAAVRLLNQAAFYLYKRARYAEAEPLYVRALAICEQQLGAEHPDTAGSLNNLALLYYHQGKYTEAEPLFVRTLAICEQQLGAMHPDTAISLNNLAMLYEKRRRYAEAEPLYVQALAICEQQLGAMHPTTAISLNNLAALYQSQRKYTEAEPLYVRALEIREQQLGAMHPDTANSLNNLAGLYQSQGKYTEAEPLYVRALTIYEQQLGAMHPDTANCINNLAGLYETQRKYAEAEPLYLRALAIFENILGQNHLNTQTVHANYMFLLILMEPDEEAKSEEGGF